MLCGLAVQVDDMLAQAQSVSKGLLEQRRVFESVQDKLATVGERFPVVNGLLNAIRRKKSKVCGHCLVWTVQRLSGASHGHQLCAV